MAKASEVGGVVAFLGIALGLATGVATGRIAARLVEQDIVRVTREAGATPIVARRSLLASDDASTRDHGLTRYKVPVTLAQPSVGPSDALVTIVEWCDLYGEPCRSMDALLSAALKRHPRELRRVFRHLAGTSREDERAHQLARVAFGQGRFWELRRRLSQLEHAPSFAALKAHARAVGLSWDNARLALERLEHASYIAAERSLARMLDVQSAPVLFINGRRLQGEPSAAALDALIEDEIARTRALVGSGAPSDIYAEIIKPAVWRTRDGAL